MSGPPLLPDLRKLSDLRLGLLYREKLRAIDRLVTGYAQLRRDCQQADKIEDEIKRREYLRDKDKAP